MLFRFASQLMSKKNKKITQIELRQPNTYNFYHTNNKVEDNVLTGVQFPCI